MLKSMTISSCLALGLAISPADGQVVRESVRRTGEVVAEGGRAIVDGTRNAVNRTGQAARNAVDNMNTRPTDIRTDTSIDADQQFDNAVQNSSDNRGYDSGTDAQYQAGYRGLNEQAAAPGQVEYEGRTYCLRHDRQGREYICLGGRPVYFDADREGQPQQHEAYKPNTQPREMDEQSAQRPAGESRFYQESEQSGASAPAPPAPPVPVRTELDSSAPATPSLNADTNIRAEQRTNLDASEDVDAEARSSVSSDSNPVNGVDADADSAADWDGESDADNANEQSADDNDDSNN